MTTTSVVVTCMCVRSGIMLHGRMMRSVSGAVTNAVYASSVTSDSTFILKNKQFGRFSDIIYYSFHNFKSDIIRYSVSGNDHSLPSVVIIVMVG